jgi:hypothetical protein
MSGQILLYVPAIPALRGMENLSLACAKYWNPVSNLKRKKE